MTAQIATAGMFVHTLDDRAVSRLVLALSGEFARLGVQTTFICSTQARHAQVAVPAGVSVANLGLGRWPTLWGVARLAALLKRLRPEVLFAHLNGPGRTAILARSVAGVRTRVVVIEHNYYSNFYKKRRWLRDPLTALLLPRADRVTGVSPAVVADLEQRFPRLRGRTAVLPSAGPDPDDLPLLACAKPDHPWFAERSRTPIVCSVGNLTPRKSQDTLLQAFAIVRQRIANVRLVLVGRFDDAEFVAKLHYLCDTLRLREHVWFAGYQENALPFIASSDVFALSSVSEGAPMVLTEAMACGVPVVSTDCPAGPSYLLDGGRSGLLVPMRDPERLADAIVRVLQDAQLRQELIRAGRERARLFTPRSVARQYLALAETGSGATN